MSCPPIGPWADALVPDTSYGTLSIDGVGLFTPAWTVTSLASLYDDPDVRGGDRLIPGRTGVLPYRRRATATRHSLPFLVVGLVDDNGIVQSDPNAQLVTNLRYLKTNVTLPTNTGDGTRTAVLTMPDGTVVTEDIHVIGLHGDTLPGAMWAGMLELSDPTGNFHVGGAP